MKLRNAWLIRVASLIVAVLARLWMATIRFKFELNGQAVDPNEYGLKQRSIYLFWHEHMLFPAGFQTNAKMHVLASHHADGELIAQVCKHLGGKVVRGSTKRGGTAALLEMLRVAKFSHLVVTPDGPRGPRRRVQVGSIVIASNADMVIVPVGIGYHLAWRFNSWDRFALPWPFSRATCITAPGIRVPPNLDRKGLERYRKIVEQRMMEATEAAEQWAQTGKRPRPMQTQQALAA